MIHDVISTIAHAVFNLAFAFPIAPLLVQSKADELSVTTMETHHASSWWQPGKVFVYIADAMIDALARVP